MRKEKRSSSSEPQTVEKSEAETATKQNIQSDDNNEKNIEKESGKISSYSRIWYGEHRVRRRVVHKSKEEQIELTKNSK